MKLKVTFSALALLSMSAAVSAQTCVTPYQGTIGASGNASFSGNNCASGTTNTLAKICSNSDFLGGTSLDIIQWTVGPSPTNPVTLSLTSAAFTPELAIVSGTCSANTACADDETIAGPGTVNASVTATAGGTYYIFVTNVTDGNCGAYNLAVAATPVKLQNFSVN
ncbi:MAG TPA: hypothetical protein VHW73_12340 [Rudaea sp.]|nr:hypothetical protein [Rudaea sp.]